MREFFETIITIAIIICTLSFGVWILGLLGNFITGFGISNKIVFFITGFAVGCFKGYFAKWMLNYGDLVHQFIVERFSRW